MLWRICGERYLTPPRPGWGEGGARRSRAAGAAGGTLCSATAASRALSQHSQGAGRAGAVREPCASRALPRPFQHFPQRCGHVPR